MSECAKLGQLVTDPTAGRDAVHVAVIPMLAVATLQPGQRLANGIVDPFLAEPVRPGQWYYLCLYPGTVTGVRHAWSHPAFPDESRPARRQPGEAVAATEEAR